MKKYVPLVLILLLMAMAMMSSCSSSRMIGCPSRITTLHPVSTTQS
ncbi:MAG: hypothetical protein IMW88_07820 [Thermoflavifilum sp.]|nr:hypothetical protein [Thermoflavifilum sp.]QOR75272.1 MAG: hypothetical protein IMW88_07820 [Thermoflavifilum sp.]